METFFLACFAFGALFTVASFLLGALGSGMGHAAHLGHHAGPLAHADAAGHAGSAGHLGNGHDAGAAADAHGPGHLSDRLPIFNVTALLAFLTWFGAAGFLLLRFGAWSLVIVLLAAALAGLVAATLIALFLRQLLAGERVMNPADYRLQGTLARVTVTIPAGGVGEIVFTKAGTRRSDAARSETGEAIARGTEVVILGHARGVASVQPWRQLLGREEERDGPTRTEETSPTALPLTSERPVA